MAAGGREVEIKFLVSSGEELRSRLRALGFHIVTRRSHENNVLYDLPGHPLRTRGEILRLRHYGDRWILTHKAKVRAGRHKSRLENETAVDSGRRLHRILLSLGFRPSFRYEKFRSEWTDGKGHVVIDETPIGIIAEIEGPPRWIDRTAAALGVSRKAYITQSYAELFAAWKQRSGSRAQVMTFAAVGRRR